jgi:hypothetical protein
MQGPPAPTRDDEASIPTEHVRNGPQLSAARRRFTKRALPWNLVSRKLNLVVSPPQDEDIRETKRPRLETPISAATPEVAVALPAAAAAAPGQTLHSSIEQASVRARAGRWTAVEDIKLKDAVQMHGGKGWNAVAASVPGRAGRQCSDRWHNSLDPSINLGNGRTGKWTAVEDSKLKAAVQIHAGKGGWNAVAALLPGRSKVQCRSRWYNALDPSIEQASVRADNWTADEDSKLKAALQTHGGRGWNVVAASVPGRTQEQCRNRWHYAEQMTRKRKEDDELPSLQDGDIQEMKRTRPFPTSTDEDTTKNTSYDNVVALRAAAAAAHAAHAHAAYAAHAAAHAAASARAAYTHAAIDPTTAPAGKWTADDDKKLRDAVRTHGCNYWVEITALFPGRTKRQCSRRWHGKLDSQIDPTTARVGRWTADEDKKLKDAVLTHGANNWKAIAALVLGRTREQCRNRWCATLDSNIDPTTARAGKWTVDEDKTLRDAVVSCGGKNWELIAALVLGRTKVQCRNRWCGTLVSKMDPTTARLGTWTVDEDTKLRDAVLSHGGKNWELINALVPGRSLSQCYNRWRKCLDPDRMTG